MGKIWKLLNYSDLWEIHDVWKIPSGNSTVCYWTWPIDNWSTYKQMVIFNSYVSLPEGNQENRNAIISNHEGILPRCWTQRTCLDHHFCYGGQTKWFAGWYIPSSSWLIMLIDHMYICVSTRRDWQIHIV